MSVGVDALQDAIVVAWAKLNERTTRESLDTKVDFLQREEYRDKFEVLDPAINTLYVIEELGTGFNWNEIGNVMFGMIQSRLGYTEPFTLLVGDMYSLYKDGALDQSNEKAAIGVGYELEAEHGKKD